MSRFIQHQQHTLICYKTLPTWNASTLPQGFQQKHNTQAGTWAKMTVLKGTLRFNLLSEQGEILEHLIIGVDTPSFFIEPQQWHNVEIIDTEFEGYLQFYCTAEEYFAKKYKMTSTHSEVKQAIHLIPPCKVLDLGCGKGRNSLFLSLLGYEVTAVDMNVQSIEHLKRIADSEHLTIKTQAYDIQQRELSEEYDWIISTVVLMFLQADQLYGVIENMQQATRIGGYNLIVAAMDTEDVPCPVPFNRPFKQHELKQLYQGWQLIKYEEAMGELHKTNAMGERIRLKFVTMLAQKLV